MERSIIKYNEENKVEGIVKGALSLTVSMLIVKLLGLFFKIPLAYIMADEGMGYFNSAYTVYTFFYLVCNAGVPKAVTMMTAESVVKGRREDERKIFVTSLVAFGLFGALLCALFILSAGPIATLIGNNGALSAMQLVAPSVLFISISGVLRGYLNGRSRLVPIAVSQLVEGCGKLLLGLALAMIGAHLEISLPGIAALAILGVTIGSFFGLLYLWIELKIENKHNKIEQKFRSELKSAEIIKRILRVAIPITLGAAVMSLTNLIDLGIVMRRLQEIGYGEAEAGALYGNYTTLAVPMFNLIAALVTPIAMTLLPIMTRAFVLKDRRSFDAALGRGMEICSFFAVPCAVGYMMFAEDILALLFEDTSAHTAAPLLMLLSPAVIFMVALTVLNTALEAVGMVRATLVSMSVGAIVKAAVSYLLVGNPSYGISGAPIGTVVFYAVAFLTSLLFLIFCGNFSFSVFGSFIRPLINASASIVLVKLLSLYLKNSFGAKVNILILIVLCAFVYLLFSGISGAFAIFKAKNMSIYTKTVEKC